MQGLTDEVLVPNWQGVGKVLARCSQGVRKVLARCSQGVGKVFAYSKWLFELAICLRNPVEVLGKSEGKA